MLQMRMLDWQSSQVMVQGFRCEEFQDAASGEAGKSSLQIQQGSSGQLVAGEGSLVGCKQMSVRIIRGDLLVGEHR